MKQKKIIYKDSIKINNNFSLKKKVNKKCLKILDKIISDLDNAKDTFHSLSNKFKLNFTKNDLKNFRKFDTIVVVGMGGSILGSKAIYHFLKKKIKKKFIFLDNINELNLDIIKSKKNLNKSLFIIVSKSGNTVETLSNLLALKIVKRKSKNILIISEKNNNALYLLSKNFNFFISNIKVI